MRKLAARVFVVLLAAVLVLALYVTAHVVSTPGTRYFTDGASIRQELAGAPLRRVLWNPPVRLAAPVASDDDENEAHVSADGRTLFFARGRAGQNADLYVSSRETTGWSPPRPLTALNTLADELGPALAPDGRTLYFHSNRAGGKGGFDLWASTRDDDDWGPAVNLGAVNSPEDEYGVTVAPDGATLYFASNRRGADAEETKDRDYDIYVAAIGAAPRPLDDINSPADEGAPALSPVGDFLYFASNRPGGRGGFDIYRARRMSDGFDPPENLDAPVNTADHEIDPAVAEQGFVLLFSSDRSRRGGAADAESAPGGYDLFSSASREVFRATENPRVPWAAIFRLVAPILPWLVLGIILALLLPFLVRLLRGDDARLRPLSIVARCLILSLAAHVVIVLVCMAWAVASGMPDFDARSTGGTQVALTSPAAGARLVAQVRGALAEADPVQPALNDLEPYTVGGDEPPEPARAEVAPGTLLALAEAPRPAKDADDAAPRRSVAPVRSVDVLVAPPPAPTAPLRAGERVVSREAAAPAAPVVTAVPGPAIRRQHEGEVAAGVEAVPMRPERRVVDVIARGAAGRAPVAAQAGVPGPPVRRPEVAAPRVAMIQTPADAPPRDAAARGRDPLPVEPASVGRTEASAPLAADEVRVSVAPEVRAPGAPRPVKIVRERFAAPPATAVPGGAGEGPGTPARLGADAAPPIAAAAAPRIVPRAPEAEPVIAGAASSERTPASPAAAPAPTRIESAPGAREASRVVTRVATAAPRRARSRAAGLGTAAPDGVANVGAPAAPAPSAPAMWPGVVDARVIAAEAPDVPGPPVATTDEGVTDVLAVAAATLPAAPRVDPGPTMLSERASRMTRRLPPDTASRVPAAERPAGAEVRDAPVPAPVTSGSSPAPTAPGAAVLTLDLPRAPAEATGAVVAEAAPASGVPTATGSRERRFAPRGAGAREVQAALAPDAAPGRAPREDDGMPEAMPEPGTAPDPIVSVRRPRAAVRSAPTLAAAPPVGTARSVVPFEAVRETAAALPVATAVPPVPVERMAFPPRTVRSPELAPAAPALAATSDLERREVRRDARVTRVNGIGPDPAPRAPGAAPPVAVPLLAARVARPAGEDAIRPRPERARRDRAKPAPPQAMVARVETFAQERGAAATLPPETRADAPRAIAAAPTSIGMASDRREAARFAPAVAGPMPAPALANAGARPRVREAGDGVGAIPIPALRARTGPEAGPPPAGRLARLPTEGAALDARPGGVRGVASARRAADAPKLPDLPARADLPSPRPGLIPLLPPIPTRAETTPYPQRAPERRAEALEKHGGGPQTERAVADALDWLMRHQSEDGRWDGDDYDEGCGRCAGAARREVSVAVTALALLSYFAADHTHVSDGPYLDTVSRGLAWLLEQQSEHGDFMAGETMYTHGAATIALAEAYGMTADATLLAPLERAVAFTAGARNSFTGGWRYVPGQDGDTSVLGWQVMSLISARRAGVAVPDEALRGAEKWLRRVSDPGAPGRYAYRPTRAPTPSMTAEGMYVQQLLGVPRDDPRMRGSVALLLENPPEWKQSQSSYYWFYSSLALFQHGGPAWTVWNRRMKETLLAGQVKSGAAAGSWPPDDVWAQVGGRVYQTALCTLTLEVYYRYLPLYLGE